MSEGEWQEDQGDDRHQVSRMGAGSCLGFREVCLDGDRDCCVVSWDAGDGPQGSVGADTKKAGYRLETSLGEYPAKRLEMRS